MRIVELFHDENHPESSNVDLWVKEYNHRSQKLPAYKGLDLPDLDSFDLIFLHGGEQHLWNKDADPWLHAEVNYIRRVLMNKKPVIGFCLGSQVIADALGVEIYQDKEIEFGWGQVMVRPEARGHMILKGLEAGFISFMWHQDHYELPPHCMSLAFTHQAANQIFVSNNLPAVGFQFHPEYSQEIVNNYYRTYWGTEFLKLKDSPPIDDFIKESNSLPDTYSLFRQLLNNTVKYLALETR
jgi:GMP synthase (glutamine-hydrolysing)